MEHARPIKVVHRVVVQLIKVVLIQLVDIKHVEQVHADAKPIIIVPTQLAVMQRVALQVVAVKHITIAKMQHVELVVLAQEGGIMMVEHHAIKECQQELYGDGIIGTVLVVAHTEDVNIIILN